MSRPSDRVEDLLRDAYGSPPPEPDLESRVLARLRRQRDPTTPGERRSRPEASDGNPPLRPAPSPAARWGLRLYWAVTTAVAIVLVARVGAADPGVVTLAAGAAAATLLGLATRAVSRATGRTAARLIVNSVG